MSFPRTFLVVSCVVISLHGPDTCRQTAFAQNQNNNQGNNNQNNQNNQNQPAGGILIDANGLVKTIFTRDKSKRLRKKRITAAMQKLSEEMKESSTMRKVSLVQLEAACQDALQNREELSDELKYLAGINRLDFLFVDPENKDIVIAGPAEPFVPDALGRMVGVYSGRPPLRLDDLVVALRVAERGNTVGCSIDPVPERLSRLQNFIRKNSSPASVSVAKRRYHTMARVLGNQTVNLWGIPPESHFAQALTEADLRMKRLSMGLEKVKVRGFRSYLSMITPTGNSMQRWWFVPFYEDIQISEDENAYQFLGQRAKLMAQEEVVDGSGFRSDATVTRQSTRRFARLFTQKFPAMVQLIPAFAELQNLIDLTVMAALLKEKGLAEKVGWQKSFFLDVEKMPIEAGEIPREVLSTANYKMANRRMVIGLVGGGVTINPRQTVRQMKFRLSAGNRLNQLQKDIAAEKPPAAHAWWRN
ncbi:MAG: DUF1598 domain-containing protein [Planctomycetes bacterium]|nr:DUF1598 domain-containing protein [Planctomycetota bacterium]